MTSPLVTRLVASINSCSDKEQRAVYIAELACYWARTGEFDEAERLRSELRRDFGEGQSTPVSILIMCLESLLLYFRELSPRARDRMLRANLISKTFQQHRLNALTSAWMAHIDFNENRFETMADELRTCAKFIHADDGGAECRASLVLADAFLFAGDTVASRVWYANAQRIATRVGDHAAIGAMTYNRAALRVSTARFANLTRPVTAEEALLINTEVNSAVNYQAAARLKSLDHLLGSAKAGALMLRGNLDQAKAEIEQLLLAADLPPTSGQLRLLQADLALINARSGVTQDAEAWLQRALELASDMTADDRALMLSAASEIAGLLGRQKRQAEFDQFASEAIDEHRKAMQSLLQQVGVFKDGTFSSSESKSDT